LGRVWKLGFEPEAVARRPDRWGARLG